MVGGLVAGPNPELPQAGQWGSTMYPANVTALIAECGETFVFDPEQKYYGAIPENYFSDPNSGVEIARTVPNHPMRVPVFGYFINDDNLTPDKKFFVESDESSLPGRHIFLKYMWDGWKIIWYAPDVDDETKESIKNFVTSRDDTIAIPWMDDAPLPMNRKFAFAGWNISQSCNKWDPDVASAFMGDAQEVHKTIDGTQPPAINLSEGEDLPRIDMPE
ncbi:MAG: DUF3105 domain-containing protein [Enterococcus sp.]|nr:DUF3105 domain-containing protein [Enterococcus sp.]